MIKNDGVLGFWDFLIVTILNEYWLRHRRIRKTVLKEMQNSGYNDAVYHVLTNKVSYAFGMAVEGDIAEFGTDEGNTAVALATAVKVQNRRYRNDPRGIKRVHYFDSFAGLPKARSDVDKNSHHVRTGIWDEGNQKGLSEIKLTKTIKKILPKDGFSIHPGWFKDTLSSLPDDTKFSLMHIDSVFYESCFDVLDPIFERRMLSKGAVILFNCYDCNRADNNFGERRAWLEMVEKYKIEFSDGGPYGVSCHWFLVHSYISPK